MKMWGFTPLRLGNRFHILRPFPAAFEGQTSHTPTANANDLSFPVSKSACFIGGRKTLVLDTCHGYTPPQIDSPDVPDGYARLYLTVQLYLTLARNRCKKLEGNKVVFH